MKNYNKNYFCICGHRKKNRCAISCVDCSISFCRSCFYRCVTWIDHSRRDREYEKCRDCCDKTCSVCKGDYNFSTASKCDRCLRIYCRKCYVGNCIDCGIYYGSPMLEYPNYTGKLGPGLRKGIPVFFVEISEKNWKPRGTVVCKKPWIPF